MSVMVSLDEVREGWVQYSTWKRVPRCGRVRAEKEFDELLESVLKGDPDE